LVEKIILPPDMIDPITDGEHAASDRLAVLHAVAVLFPITAREILMPAYASKKLTPADISDLKSTAPASPKVCSSQSMTGFSKTSCLGVQAADGAIPAPRPQRRMA
jgi:hypothetical protein